MTNLIKKWRQLICLHLGARNYCHECKKRLKPIVFGNSKLCETCLRVGDNCKCEVMK